MLKLTKLGGTFALALAGLIGTGIAVSALVPDGADEVTEPTVEQIRRLSSDLDLPLVVPKVLPPGFEWADQIAVDADNSHARSRTVMYFNDTSNSSVETCIARVADDCGIESDDISTRVGGLWVVVHFWTPTDAKTRQAWANLDYSSDFDHIAWLGRA